MFSLNHQKQSKFRIKELYQQLSNAETQLVVAVTAGMDSFSAQYQIAIAESALNEITAKKTAEKFITRRQECYEYNECLGHILAVRTRQKLRAGYIREIKTIRVDSISDPYDIREVFREYYSKVYYAQLPPVGKENLKQFLNLKVSEEATQDDHDFLGPDFSEEKNSGSIPRMT